MANAARISQRGLDRAPAVINWIDRFVGGHRVHALSAANAT
jgi:hypothetical protein